MTQTNLLELESLVNETANQNGFEICSVQLLSHRLPITMQVQIRRVGGGDVSLDDCSRFSNLMSDVLENSPVINANYVLEISSPGIGENLVNDRDFETFKGFPIQVTFKNAKNDKMLSSGLLHKRCIDYVHLNIKGKIDRIPRDEVIGVRLTSP